MPTVCSQIFGPCAVPFGLEKQTLLRIALQEVLRPEVNIYVSMVKMVSALFHSYTQLWCTEGHMDVQTDVRVD